MKLGNLAVTSMRNEKSKYYFLIINLTFAVAVSIIFAHFMSNPTLGFSGELAKQMVSDNTLPVVYLFMMAACIILVAVALVFYANESYLANQKKTLSILSMSGASLVAITKYFAIQHVICMLVAIILGVLISLVGLPIINFFMSMTSNIAIPLFSYDTQAFLLGFVIVAVMLFFLWLCDVGYVYRTDKFELTKPHSTVQQVDVMPGKKVFSMVGYLVPLGMMLLIPPVLELYLVYMIIGMFGISGIFHNILPMVFGRQQRKYAYDPIRSMLYTNLIDAVKQNGFLTKMISIAMMVLSVLLCSNADASLTITFISISFVILIAMMLLCIYNNMTTMAVNRSQQYQTLNLIGYDRKMIEQMIKKEQHWYFALLFLLPFIYVLVCVTKFTIFEHVQVLFTAAVLFVFLLLIVLCEKLCELPHKAVLKNRRMSS